MKCIHLKLFKQFYYKYLIYIQQIKKKLWKLTKKLSKSLIPNKLSEIIIEHLLKSINEKWKASKRLQNIIYEHQHKNHMLTDKTRIKKTKLSTWDLLLIAKTFTFYMYNMTLSYDWSTVINVKVCFMKTFENDESQWSNRLIFRILRSRLLII